MMSLPEEVLDLCARIATHTDVPGTITRLFGSPATRDVQTLLRAEMQSVGLTVRLDSAGNLRGLYAGQTPDAPVLLIGSHLDTVPNAGAYDGVLGVALPLVLLRSLAGRRFPFAIELVAFSEEEGYRFRMPFIGSRALLGDLGPADMARTDTDGIDLAAALQTLASQLHSDDAQPFDLSDARFTPGTFAFLEVHIEQGPVLESLGLPLGVVSTIAGQSRFNLTFTGKANHAGTTPMHLRRDALATAAAWLPLVEKHARKSKIVATVGELNVSPGASNVIPGKVTLTLDIRHPDDAVRIETSRNLTELARFTAATRKIHFDCVETSTHAATPMDDRLRAALTAAARAAGHRPHGMASGAGHDAMILAPHIPTAMLFVRSPGGISHHPDESVLPDDLQAALDTCLHFLNSLAPDTLAPNSLAPDSLAPDTLAPDTLPQSAFEGTS
jgi:allantoate deiminase